MVRSPRVSYPGAVYHVKSRGVNRQAILKDVQDTSRYVEVDVVVDRGTLRDVVMECLCRHAGMHGAEVAMMFGLHESTVSKYRKRVRTRITEDSKIKRLVED